MFDDLEPKKSDNLDLNQENDSQEGGEFEKKESLNKTEEKPQGIAEDIFSDEGKDLIDGGKISSLNEGKEKPDVFKPVKEDKNDVLEESYGGFPFIKIIIVFLVLGVVAGSAYFIYSRNILDSFFNKKAVEENTEMDSNNKTKEKTNTENNVTENNPEDNIENEIEENIPVKEEIINELDTDGDGLGDRLEISIGTNINSIDTDGDGLFDREEVQVYKTDPKNEDTDGDGFLDGAEVKDGYNPNGPGKLYDINE